MHRSIAALTLLLTSMLYAVICQAQILGTGQLNSARRSHTATLLQDGKILIVGGDDASGLVGQAEIFDPASLTSSNIATNPIALRTDHTATLLADGRVLIIGGVDGNGSLASTEFYNPYSVPAPSFSAGPPLQRTRSGHTSTVLANGKILIIGGDASGSAEIYDPATQTFSLVSGSLNTPRQYHSAVLLNSGQVLIAGGVVGANTVLNSAEIYDPQTQSFTPASGAMQTPRGLALLRVLPDGKVQLIGGDGEFSMEMFDPASNSFIALAHIPPHDDYLNSILLSRTRSALITTIIQQNPVLQGKPELTPEIIALLNRLDHTVTEIPQSNRALIAGGVSDAGQILSSATMVSSSAATVTTDKFDYAPGETVTIAGQGWQPNETVWMLLHEEPETHDDVVTSSVADNQGNFTNSDFAPATADAGRSFTLTAIGQTSGFTTQTAFKDAPRIASVSVGVQTGTLTFGTAGSATYAITPVRGNNGTVNGTLSVISGLPTGVTASFSPNSGTWTSMGGTAFPSFTLTLTTSATAPAGTFTFTVRAADGSDTATNTGTLTIGKATPTITWNNPANITYGTALSGTQLNATASVPGSFVYTPASGTVLSAGNGQTLHVDFTPTDTANYNNASKNVTINVQKATPTINWSNPADITYGTALSATQLNATANAVVNGSTVTVVGTFTYTPGSGTVLNAGNAQTLHVSFVPTDTTNYSSPVTKDVTINVLKKDATWTTNPNSKIYGDADPVPLTTGSGSGFLTADNVTAMYSRVVGENASPPTYHITATLSATPLAALNNYNIINTGNEFTVNKRNATWTTNAASKTYGDADPVPLTTGSGSGFLAADSVTATYSRIAGESVAGNPYHISATLSPAGVLGNYNITNAGADFTINKKNASVDATDAAKIYSDADPTLTTTNSGFLAADLGPTKITFSASRAAGENVGTYAITPSSSDNGTGLLNNYNVTFNNGTFTIKKRPITVTADAKSKTYGDADPALTYQITAGSLKSGDSITGAVTRAAGENVGTYAITQGTLTISDGNGGNNYDLTFVGSLLTIIKADPIVTATGNTCTYNGNTCAGSGTATGVHGENLTPVTLAYSDAPGHLLTSAPVNAGIYAAAARYAGDANYNPKQSAAAVITINKQLASVTPNAASKTYGNADPALTGTLFGFVAGDGVTAVYSRTGGENVGPYTISATLSPTAVLANYDITYNTANFTINKADPIVMATGNVCTYNGSPCAGSGTATGVGGESLTPVMLAYATTPGPGNLLASAPVNAGTYHVAARYAGDLNYNQKQSAPATITILQAAQTITVTQEPPASAYYNQTFTVAATASSGLVVSIVSSGSCSGSGTSSALITMTAGSGICMISFDQSGDANYQAAAQVTRSVTALNTAPVAQAQSVATSEDVPVDVILSGSDIDNGSLAFSIVNPPAHGSLGSVSSPSCVPNGIGANCTATVNYSPAPDYNGSDSFSFKVNDGSADSNVAIVSITVKPVNDAPTANAQTVTANSGAPKSIDFTGSDIETQAANLTFKIAALPTHGSLTDWQNNILTTNSTLTGSPATVIYTPDLSYEGPDSFTFTVTDRGDPDNCGAPSASCDDKKTSPAATVAISVTDATAPDTTITDKPALLSNNPNPSFSFTGTDNVTPAGDLAFECKLDSGSFLACASPVNYTGLADGAHTFQVHAKDAFGNLDGTEASYSWTVDATPPDTVIDSAPSALTNVATATFTFHSTENNSTFVCTVDGSSAACGGGTFTTASLADGAHTFTVAAVDQAGNLDPTAASVMWTIDTLAPHTTINNGPSNPTTGTSATFAFSSANSPGDTFECRLDGVPAGFASCTSPVTYTSLSVGNHAFEVRGKDAIGNMETTPASYSWTIGAVTIENYTMDSDFKRFDGFDVVFSKGSGSYLKINSTNPDSFHYQIKLTNNTGIPIGAAHGNNATAIITVPGMPASCGGVPCSSQIGSLGDPAFVLKGRKVAHVWPGYHDRDDDDDDDDMPVSVKYMTVEQYQANGNSCADNSGYSSTFPSNGAPKCLKISGFTIPVRHAARIRLNFHFRLKGTDGWNANSQQLFHAGFVFRAATSVNFGSNIQTIYDAAGLVGAGKKATAVGGYVFDGATPGAGYMVRLFTKRSDASCTVDTKLVAQSQVDSNGFYYIWRSGLNQSSSTAPSLPSGVQYAVQLCNSSTQIDLKTTDNRLRDKELEQVDFNP